MQSSTILTVSPKGQLTLPAAMRKALGLRPGSTVIAAVADGQMTLSPAVVLPVEVYDDDRQREFAAAAAMSAAELDAARRRWGL